jgi:hypothetical protein
VIAESVAEAVTFGRGKDIRIGLPQLRRYPSFLEIIVVPRSLRRAFC